MSKVTVNAEKTLSLTVDSDQFIDAFAVGFGKDIFLMEFGILSNEVTDKSGISPDEILEITGRNRFHLTPDVFKGVVHNLIETLKRYEDMYGVIEIEERGDDDGNVL